MADKIDEKETLKNVLIAKATLIHNEEDASSWCYLPYWFEITSDGKILAYRTNDLPEELKQQIQTQRDGR